MLIKKPSFLGLNYALRLRIMIIKAIAPASIANIKGFIHAEGSSLASFAGSVFVAPVHFFSSVVVFTVGTSVAMIAVGLFGASRTISSKIFRFLGVVNSFSQYAPSFIIIPSSDIALMSVSLYDVLQLNESASMILIVFPSLPHEKLSTRTFDSSDCFAIRARIDSFITG